MYRFTKRLFDVVMAAAALAVAAPFLLLIAIIIRVDSRGPALYRQRRLGKNRRPFTMFKLRTMRQDADDSLHREAVKRAADGVRTELSDGTLVFKSPEDPRITRVGKFLRASCIDELPQLFNVLRAEMSIVGPRPALEYELAHYKDWHHQRFAVRPGLTGLWQVHRASAEDLDDMLSLDVEYSTSTTTWNDLKLIAMTIPAIVRERGVF